MTSCAHTVHIQHTAQRKKGHKNKLSCYIWVIYLYAPTNESEGHPFYHSGPKQTLFSTWIIRVTYCGAGDLAINSFEYMNELL